MRFRVPRVAMRAALLAAPLLLSSCLTPPAPADTYVGPVKEPAPRVEGVPTPKTAPAAPTVPATGPLALSVSEALVAAMEHNRGLSVQRVGPELSRTREEEERAIFDTTLAADAQTRRAVTQRLARAGSGTESTISDTRDASATLTRELPTGTTLEATADINETNSSLYSAPFASVRTGITATQALLQGYGTTVNLVSIGQADLATRISEYELRGYTESLAATVEKTYWDVVLAEREIAIYEDSVKLAQQQLDETRESIRLGRLSEIELSASQAELALRQEDLINAQSQLATVRLQLLQLLNLPGDRWGRELKLSGEPVVPAEPLGSVEDHVTLSKRLRPDLNQARLELASNELEIVRTRNGLLPKLDFFLTLGQTGYAGSFGPALRDANDEFYDVTAGLTFEMPLENRAAKARHARATLSRDQAADSLENLADLVELDVRTAWIEVERARKQIDATAATRRLQEAKYQAELDKFHVGRSTSLLVAQAQRDLIASRLSEVEAVVNLLKARVDLFRLEGTLLLRSGISAPGKVPAPPSPARAAQP